MKVNSYNDDTQYEEIESLQIIIKSIPYENGFVPSFFIMSPEDNYAMTISELNALMDGIEIAKNKIDEIIDYILRKKVFKEDVDDTGLQD
jgi:hypothetical protein